MAKRSALHLLVAAMAAFAMLGCQPGHKLKLKYWPGNRPVAQFTPSRVAVIPAGDSSVGQLFVGSVFDPDGNVERLYVVDPPGRCRLLASHLEHNGLRPMILAVGSEVPDGVDYTVSCNPEELTVVKRIDRANGGGKNSFLMKAGARLKCTLAARDGTTIFSDRFSSMEDEPPLGEAAHSRPLISDPAQALSVAVSDALDAFMDTPAFHRALQSNEANTDFPPPAPSTSETTTPSPAATPGRQPGSTGAKPGTPVLH
jgi:hypothetical protein